jgi:transglutaminase-like putative cysteine protease
LAAAVALMGVGSADNSARAQQPESRTFQFTYTTTVTGLTPGKTAKVWLPLPPTTPHQEVTAEKQTVPGKSSVGTDPLYGNKMLFVEAVADKDGNLPVTLVFKVVRKEVKGIDNVLKPGPSEKIQRFLQPDKLVPIDGKPLELIKNKQLGKTPMETAKLLYDIVNAHMKYSKKGIGWGNGDVEWACDSKFGNCSDFHSVFISLARSQKIPAKFEMGFPLPVKRGSGTVGGYHCWAWFLPDSKGWVPVDISEANQHPAKTDYYFGNLSADRVLFTTGRDIDLEPRQSGPALNFFIYPYAEVDGKAVPREQIKNTFSYADA